MRRSSNSSRMKITSWLLLSSFPFLITILGNLSCCIVIFLSFFFSLGLILKFYLLFLPLFLLFFELFINGHLPLFLHLLSSFSLFPFNSLLVFNQLAADRVGKIKFNLVVFHKFCNCISAIINPREIFEKRNQIKELSIFWIIIPTNDGDSLLRLEHVSRWRVIQDHGIFRSSSYFGHIFGKYTV